MAFARHRVAELMDAADLPARDHEAALRGLARLNRWSLADRPYRGAILRVAARRGSGRTPARVLDVATGSSDVVVRLARWAARRGLKVEWHACDVSATALEIARRRAEEAGVLLRTFVANVLSDGALVGGEFDLVTCGLFLHHLDPPEVVRVLAAFGGACARREGGGEVVVSDLRRDRLGMVAAVVASRVLSRSPIVHFDAPASVRGAYTMEELRGMAESAGLSGARVRAVWPRRMLLEWSAGAGTSVGVPGERMIAGG